MRIEHLDTPFGRLSMVKHDLFEPIDQDYEDAKKLIREVVEAQP